MSYQYLPNAVSGFRFIMMPLVVYFALQGNRDLFFIFLVMMQVTDFLDGYLARKLSAQSELGAKLDMLGDACSYIAGGIGLYAFFPVYLDGFFLILVIFFSLSYLSRYLFSKFSLGVWVYPINHVTGKVTFYSQSLLILSMYFTWELTPWFFCIALLSGLVESYFYFENILDLNNDVKEVGFKS
ncbi:CDP-alcohol phosphatidyltransferase family protein [Oceanospirillum sp. HFRX-1_2]